MKKQLLCVILFTAIVASLGLTGCTKKKAEDCRIQFLTSFFTSNYNGRFDAFSDDAEVTDKLLNDYYKDFGAYTTDHYIEVMKSNCEPLKYDREYAASGQSVSPENIQFTEQKEVNGRDCYSFTLSLSVTSANAEKDTLPVHGQIYIDSSTGKVDQIYFEPDAK